MNELDADDLTLPIKRTDGETIEDRLTGNAYHNILPARYLRKDADGELIEDQEELFERVGKNIALAEAVYEADRQDVEVTVRPEQIKPDHPRRDELAAEVFGAGTTVDDDRETRLTEHNVNKFAYETVVPELPDGVREHVESTAAEFRELMEDLSFMPNCVPPDSMVAAEGGLKQLTDIEPGERVYDDRDGQARVDSKFENGEKLVREIETASGYTVRATPEHYFRVISESGEYEWRQVKDLQPDDVMALQTGFLDDDGAPASLVPPTAADGGTAVAETTDLGRPREAIDVPDSMTPALAEWLGLYIGDGTARESGVRVAFDDQDEDLVEYWCELTESVFGFEPTTRHRNDAACVIGQAGRRDLYDFLGRNDLLKDTSKTATVPEAVLESGRTCVARFLRGLFEADGTVGERAIELYTHSEALADQAQKLLLGLGIRSVVSDKRDGHRVTIRKNECGKQFVEQVGFSSDRKRVDAKRFETVADNATSVEIQEQFYERVSSVDDVGRMAVEDMQVPRRNTYVVEGFVSHNSPTLMNAGDELQQLSACFVDSPSDDIDDIHQTAKEAANVFQCLTARTTVHVEGKGIVSIAEVEPGDEIRQREGDGHRTRTVEETHAYDDAPVHRVETDAGIELVGTPNHELLVDGEWTRIDHIGAGDTLSVRLGWLPDADETDPLETVPEGGQWASNRKVSNDEIRDLYAEGLSDYEIADRLDCSASTVQRRRADELELVPNGTGGRTRGDVSFDAGEFERLYDEGHTDGEIAAELGVSAASVGQHRATRSLEPNGDPVNSVVQPTTLTPDLAELLGMWIGDGSKHADGIRFHLNREENLEHADRLCRRLFDEGLDWRYEDGCYDAVLHSHEIKRFWLANFGSDKPDAPSASVPDAVRAGDHDTVAAFLRGLFSTDGSLQNGRYPRLWSASEDLIAGVQQLLLGLGIPATTWELDSEDRDYFNVGPTGEAGLTEFAERVGFLDARDDEMVAALEDTDFRGTTVGTIRDDGTWDVPVSAVEPAGTDVVYDVTVAGNHEYVADSVVSHNSGGGMGYAFWRLRPYGDPVGSTGGIASGPITFMRTYDQMCFPAGTRVLTPGGQRPIEELDAGDFVIDENGDRQPVVETMERHVEEDLVEVTPKRLNRPIRATGEHPFRVARDDGFEWVDAADLRPGDRLVLGHATGEDELSMDETLDLTSIASGPLVFTDGGVRVNREYYSATKGTSPQSFASEVPMRDFATIAGWYLAEGCVVYRRGMPSEVTFTLHSDESDAAAEIRDALEAFDVPSRLDPVEDRNTLHVHAEHSSFAQFAEELFGTGASQKRVPDVLWNATPEVQARTLEALFDGDGRLEKRGKSQRAKLKLTSESVIDFAFQVGLRCGVQFSQHDRTPDDRQPTYEVSVSVSTALDTPLERLFDDVDEEFSARDRTKQAHGREVVTVDTVERIPYEGPVYNAEVADTHTYVAEDLVVHNCETIAQGGARRGAQMGVMRVSHPDVVQFIHAKNKDVSLAHTLRLNDPDDFTHTSFAEALEEARDLIDDEGRVPEHLRNAVEGHLSNFNISVGITDEFMDAVEAGEEFTFTNPRTGEAHVATPQTKELYEMFDLGEHVEVGEVLSVPAELIWERIVEGAHENGEPGVIYLERVNKEHSFDVEEHPKHQILATNPCGEQPLEEYEACNLGHINLSTLAAEGAPDWRVWSDQHGREYDSRADAIEAFLDESIDWEAFDRRIEMGTRFLENVVTMSDFPVPEIEQKVREMRKIGLGIMGLAQLYVQLGVKYGSDAGNEIARQLMRHINHHSKWTSRELADERGTFAEWEHSKYADPTEYREWFEHQTGLDADDWEGGFPIRNHNTTTIAPTGTTSMVGNTTGGCEPIYNVAYYKNVSDDVQGDEMLVEFDDYFLRVLEDNDIDVEAVKQEAQEQMAENEFAGVEGLSTVPDAIGELFVTTGDLSAKQHASVQTACQDGVDSAISKTVNAPNDSTVADAKEVFEYIYDHGGKGVTYYRDGTRSKQVLTTRAQNTEFADMDPEEVVAQVENVFDGIEGFLDHEAVQAALDASVSELLGGTDADDGPEEFAQKQPRPDVLHGVTQRIDTGYGKLYVNINEDPEADRPFELFANIGNSGGFTASFTEALAKTISTALRAGVDPYEIADELQGIRSPKVAWDKGEQIQSIPDAIGTAMRRYLDGDVERAYPQQQTLEETAEDSVGGQQEREPEPEAKAGAVSEPEPDGGVASETTEGQAQARAEEKDAQQTAIDAGESPECPECGSLSLYYSEGCKTCESCGWSEC